MEGRSTEADRTQLERQSVEGRSTESKCPWKRTPSNAYHTGLVNAIKFCVENHLHLGNVVAARIGGGVRVYPSLKGYSLALVIAARPCIDYTQYIDMGRPKL